MYQYKAHVTKVYDGDTITVAINLGFGILFEKQKLRLMSINAPEVRGESREEGIKSRDALRELILNKDVIVETVKDKKGKYGRYLATVFVVKTEYINEEYGDATTVNVNDWLVKNKFAEWKEY